MNRRPKMNSLNSEASILPRRMSADLNRKPSSWERVIFSLVMLHFVLVSGTAGGLPPPLPRNISFRRVTHNPGQGHFFLFRYPFERLVDIRSEERRVGTEC